MWIKARVYLYLQWRSHLLSLFNLRVIPAFNEDNDDIPQPTGQRQQLGRIDAGPQHCGRGPGALSMNARHSFLVTELWDGSGVTEDELSRWARGDFILAV